MGSSGTMGGSLSHEYHYISKIGEDHLLFCKKCGYSGNTELSGKEDCPNCGNKETDIKTGIEVGHTFLLGEKYSDPLKANYLNSNSKAVALQMGSYGLGLSRIIAASIEVLSEEQEMRWPKSIVPYKIIIVTPKVQKLLS